MRKEPLFEEYEDERRNVFLGMIESRFSEWAAFGLKPTYVTDVGWEDRLIISIDLLAESGAHIFRMLRIDFFGERVEVGYDATLQHSFITENSLRMRQLLAGESIEDLANWVVDWVCEELASL